MRSHMLPLSLMLILGNALASEPTVEPSTASPSIPPSESSSSSPSVSPSTPPAVEDFLHVMITWIENPSGALFDLSQPCSEFAFAGSQCSLNLQFCVQDINDVNDCDYVDYGTVSVGSNFAQMMEGPYNNGVNPSVVNLTSYFQGFKFKVLLNSQNGKLIDEWKGYYNDSSLPLKGISTFYSTSARSTSIQLAWLSNAAAPKTTTVPLKTTETTDFSSQPSSTPVTPSENPRDCEEVSNRTSGVYDIYPDGTTAVSVFCWFSQNELSAALTVIQSRDANGNDKGDWKTDFDDYPQNFGTPKSNFWLGLDNMVTLTSITSSQYTLHIDVCCGSSLIDSQTYNNFSISSSPDYKLNAIPTITGFGLDFSNPNTDTPTKDLGASFTTFDKAGDLVSDCDILGVILSEGSTNYTSSGGWWFGSCTNNLNAPFPAETLTNCVISDVTKPDDAPGVQLRSLNSSPYSSDISFDGVSYTKVRMSIYRADKPLLQYDSEDFCKS